MPIVMGTQGQPDFTEPIELMMDCHRRIEHFLGVLQRVSTRYANRPLDASANLALETSLNYFHAAAPRHTADEEQSLFPRMRVIRHDEVRRAMDEIDRLESDHRKAEAAHARLDVLGRTWVKFNTLHVTALDEFSHLLGDLSKAYGEHIPIEDTSVFVLAKRVLAPEQLLEVGREMKQRRIEDPGREGSVCAESRKQRLRGGVKTLTAHKPVKRESNDCPWCAQQHCPPT